jgi:hypothetical protein
MARTRGVVVQISAEENTGRAFSAVNEQINTLKAQVASLRAELAGTGDGFRRLGAEGEAAITPLQKVRALTRGLAGTESITTMERFISQFPALVKVASSFFQVLGAAGVAGLVVELAARFVDFEQKAVHASKAIRDAFQEQHDKAQINLDDINLQNDKLQEQIDKLEHKPNNGLAVALDEAKLAADKLITSLEEVQKEIASTLSQNSVSFLGGLLTGVSGTGTQEKQINQDNQQLIQAARKANAEYLDAITGAKDDSQVQALGEKRADQIRQLFDPVIARYHAEAERLRKEQADSQRHASEAADRGMYFRPIDNGAKIANVQGEAQSIETARDLELAGIRRGSLEGTVAKLHGAPRSKDDQQKMLEAQRQLEDAMRKAADEAAQHKATVQKVAADLELVQLDQKHKRQLVSDVDYYAQRADIQKRALEAEQSANYQKQGGLRDEIASRIGGLSKDTDPAKRMADEAKIVELQTQLATLEDKRLGIAQQIAKVETEGATQTFEVTKKAEDAARNLAAQLEGERGGSTAARLAKLRDEYDDKRRAMAPAGAAALADLDSQQGIDEAKIGVEGAQQDSNANVAGIGAKRSAVAHAVATGAMSEQAAQQARIQLDREEAAALEPVLQAYEALAATGDQAAAGKVQELSEKIAELRTPVSQVAEEIRTQLNGALEQLFENLGKGKSAWQDFAKALQSMALKDTYQQFLQPLVQTALGHVIPNGGGPGRAPGAAAIPGASGGGSWLSSLVPGLAKALPSAAGARSGSGVTVQIINQTSSPAQGTASQQTAQDGSAMTEMLRPQVIQIMLEDLDRGGSFAQALSGLGGLATG